MLFGNHAMAQQNIFFVFGGYELWQKRSMCITHSFKNKKVIRYFKCIHIIVNIYLSKLISIIINFKQFDFSIKSLTINISQ